MCVERERERERESFTRCWGKILVQNCEFYINNPPVVVVVVVGGQFRVRAAHFALMLLFAILVSSVLH